MAIFNGKPARQDPGHGTTIIAAGTKLVGDLALTDKLHVDGTVEGDIESSADIAIGGEGRVQGRVQAEAVIVSGRIQGSVSARRLEILAGGAIEGDVHVVELVIEPGGRFNGSSEIVSEQESRSEAVRKSAPKTAPESKPAKPDLTRVASESSQ